MICGGGEEVGTRTTFVAPWTMDGDGAFTPLDTWISVNIRSSSAKPVNVADSLTGSSCSCSETISPLSIAGCGPRGVGVEGVGTSLPATSA